MTVGTDDPRQDRTGDKLDVSKRLGDFRLAMSLTIPAHGVTALFGASGSGKTSLLRLIAGLDQPDTGTVRIGGDTLVDTARGRFVPPHRRGLGVVFQEARLFPHYRVRGNLTYGMRGTGRRRFDDIVALLGLEDLLARFPATLSGGEARRVAIGRALLSEPRLLLLDEPLTGLDEARKREMLRYIGRLVREVDVPVAYVSHEPGEIAAVADRLVLIENGGVLAQGPLDELLARFDLTPHLGGFDAVSVLDATIERHEPDYALTHLVLADGQRLTVPAVDEPVGATLRLRVPVRDVALALSDPAGTSYRNRLSATIERIGEAGAGSAVELRLRVGGQALRARLTRKSLAEMALHEGMPVTALIRTVAFDMRR